MKTVFYNARIFDGTTFITDKNIFVEDGIIIDIAAKTNYPEGFHQIDLQGNMLCPGLIDLQIYGNGDQLFSAELNSSSIKRIDKLLLKQGCTSYLMCLATNTLEVHKRAINIFRKSTSRVAMGLHLEGPFLNKTKRGAHPNSLIINATRDNIEYLLEKDDNQIVKMMTVAPECIDDVCLNLLLSRNILLSAGHSNATYEEAVAGFDKGIRCGTHLYNAMSSFHHRDVGLTGALFQHPSARASIILDGIHVSYEAARIAKQLMGDRLFLITDAVAACNKGVYSHIFNKDHYELPNGTLSGSAISLLQSIKNAIQYLDLPVEEAIRMATIYPADLINRQDLGRVEKGARANLIALDDDLDLKGVWLEGIAQE